MLMRRFLVVLAVVGGFLAAPTVAALPGPDVADMVDATLDGAYRIVYCVVIPWSDTLNHCILAALLDTVGRVVDDL